MKKSFFMIGLATLMSICLPSCKKFTEITPKGNTTFKKVSDLDILLNFNYTGGDANSAQAAFSPYDVGNLINDTYAYSTNIPSLITSKIQSLNYAYTVYDESVNRKALAITDIKYEKLYFIINNVCNVVIRNADNASGDRKKANQLKAEAYILRAYLHYLLVNLYARAYDPATASTDGGIPYVTEDNVISEPNLKSTVAEVYTGIQNDINAAMNLNSLPAVPVNNMRVGQGFAFAVKSIVLLTLRNYPGALEAANSSLAINSTLNDDRLFAPVGTAPFTKPLVTAPENLFYMGYSGSPLISTPSIEATNSYYEPGNIINSYVKPYYAGGNPFSGLPDSKLWLYSSKPYAINTAGLTTSDTYLVRAECLARTGKLTDALAAINEIRQKRIHSDIYEPVIADTESGVMQLLMRTSRTELLYSMRNFFNIKRWNTEPAYQQTITRTINGVTYSLKPSSVLYIFPFPQSGTNYNPNLSQNY